MYRKQSFRPYNRDLEIAIHVCKDQWGDALNCLRRYKETGNKRLKKGASYHLRLMDRWAEEVHRLARMEIGDL